jgi:hypothetical protein
VGLVVGANLVLRFALEIGALVAVSVWGLSAADGVLRLLLGVGAPLLVAVVWGLFVSPNARVPLPEPAVVVLEVAVLGAATAALSGSGHGRAAVVFGALAAVHLPLHHTVGRAIARQGA